MRQKKSGPIAGDEAAKKYVEPNDVIPTAPRASSRWPGRLGALSGTNGATPGKPQWGFDSSWPASIGRLT